MTLGWTKVFLYDRKRMIHKFFNKSDDQNSKLLLFKDPVENKTYLRCHILLYVFYQNKTLEMKRHAIGWKKKMWKATI